MFLHKPRGSIDRMHLRVKCVPFRERAHALIESNCSLFCVCFIHWWQSPAGESRIEGFTEFVPWKSFDITHCVGQTSEDVFQVFLKFKGIFRVDFWFVKLLLSGIELAWGWSSLWRMAAELHAFFLLYECEKKKLFLIFINARKWRKSWVNICRKL